MSSADQRARAIAQHVTPPMSKARAALLQKDPDDVVITLAKRTALTKAGKGALKDTPLEGLLLSILEYIRDQSGIDPSLVEEVVVGNVLHPSPTFVARAAVLATFPATTCTSTVSRWCSSGLLAVQSIANQIASRNIDIGIAIGAESMSLNIQGADPVRIEAEIATLPIVQDHYKPMGWTSENVARDFNVSRVSQDEYATVSHQKAEAAQKAGWFDEEIIPIRAKIMDHSTGQVKVVQVDRDEGIRRGTSLEGLSKLKGAFPQWSPSTTTGGNASQITDGAAGLLLMRRSIAEKLSRPVLGKFVISTEAGLQPRIMGIGPVYAIPKLLNKVGLNLEEVDVVEINEAFASMAVYCQENLGLSHRKLNPRGGAIALGHPLACTGARQIVSALSELKRTRQKIAITSMCVGSGQSMASLIVSEAL